MFEEFYVDVGSVRLHCLAAGRGPLMLFIHGFPEFSGAWHRQIEYFSSRFRAVAVDLRGFNLSDKPAGRDAYKPKHIVADILALIAALGAGKAIIVGHDWGGAIALNFAAQHSECVEKLVILNAPHPALFARELVENEAQQRASAYMNFFREDHAEEKLAANSFRLLRDIMANWGTGEDVLDPCELETYLAAWSQKGALTAALNYYRASPLHPPEFPRDSLDRESADQPRSRGTVGVGSLDPSRSIVLAPTLVIWGEKDQALLPTLLRGLEDFVPDLRIKRIPDGTHWVVHEFPNRINQLIENFIDLPQSARD